MAFQAVAFGVGAGLAGLSAIFGLKASKAKRRQAKAERRAQEISNFRAVREVIRVSRLARAANISNAAASGAELGSSGVQGSLASVGARAGSSLFINNQISALQKNAFDQSLKADKFSTFSSIAGSFASLALTAGATFGGTTPDPTTGVKTFGLPAQPESFAFEPIGGGG